MKYQEFAREFEKGRLHNAYLLTGTEDYLVDECLQMLSNKLVDPATREFNFDVFYASQVDAGRILDAASAYPMLAESRFVVVKELHRLSASDLEALAKFLKHQPPATKMALITDKLTGRSKAQSQIKEACCTVECKPLYDNQVPDWIQSHLRKQGYDIEYGASLLIHAHVGNSLRAIVQELEKVKLNIEGKKILESDIQRVVGLSRSFSVFNLNDALGNRQIDKALLILGKMLESGESPTAILAMISRHFMTLLKVKGATAQKKSKQQITAMTGVPPFFIDKTKKMASSYEAKQFDEIFKILIETDLALKTSQLAPGIALETMVVKMLRS